MVLLQGGTEAIAKTLRAARARNIVTEFRSEAGHHAVIEAGGVRHRILVTKPDYPHSSGFLLPDDPALPARMAALFSFDRWRRSSGSVAPSRHLHPTSYQRHRLQLMLRVLDLHSHASGKPLTLRDLAGKVLRADADLERAIEWKTSSARRRVQRLIADARRLGNHDYLELLACRMAKY